jgi:hypothetical protein
MNTNPIGNPKLAIAASVLMGALTLTVLTLHPRKGVLPVDPTAFGHRDAWSAGAPDSPRGASMVSGKISVAPDTGSEAGLMGVLDAVRVSLQRNDLASAKVLLDAEQALYVGDPRVAALQSELQVREQAADRTALVEHSGKSSATSHSSGAGWRSSPRTEHGRGAVATIHELAGSESRDARSRRVPEVEAVASKSVKPQVSNADAANPQGAVVSLAPAQPVAEAPTAAQSVALPPPVMQALQTTQSDPAQSSAPTLSTQAPKTREQVRMEVERARADGDLPRFGNPDPAGPGGAPSRVTHSLVLDW